VLGRLVERHDTEDAERARGVQGVLAELPRALLARQPEREQLHQCDPEEDIPGALPIFLVLDD
jgi:hypothetical protein